MQLPPHGTCNRFRARFANPAHGHAQMLAFDDDDDSPRLEVLDERLGDLSGKAFLNLGSASIEIHQTGKLTKPGYSPVVRWDVPDMGEAVEWNQMVFAR